MGDKRMGKAALNRIENSTRVYFSAVSIFELNMKALNEKLRLPEDFGTALLSIGFMELPLKSEDALNLKDYPSLVAHDPFDRMILRQAARHDKVFITSDAKLLSLGLDWIVDAQA